jgi:hypothetical protein
MLHAAQLTTVQHLVMLLRMVYKALSCSDATASQLPVPLHPDLQFSRMPQMHIVQARAYLG